MTSDAKLLDEWRRGDKNAGARLLKRHYETVVRFFGNKVNTPQEREDLVQETLAACVEARTRIKDGSCFRAYLLQIAHNKFKRHLRRRYTVADQDLSSRSMQDIMPGASTMLRRREEKKRLLMALREIPVYMQIVLELKFWEGLSSREIASVLGSNSNTVRSYMMHGRRLLREKLKDAYTSKETRNIDENRRET